jgi:hypothetical protein
MNHITITKLKKEYLLELKTDNEFLKILKLMEGVISFK